MKAANEIRFIATNFYNLQGLRTVPLGFCLMLVSFWANGLHGPARDFFVPVLGLLISSLLLFGIDRYYLYTFGRVQRTLASRRLERLVETVGGMLALAAFWLDVSLRLPVSLLGLVFAACLLADYIRLTWFVRGRSLVYYPLGALLMAGVSILQLFGFTAWWLALGLKSQLVGICMAIGAFTIVAGLWGHIFLVQTLPSPRHGGRS